MKSRPGNTSTETVLLRVEEVRGAAVACDLQDANDTPEERIAEYGRLFAHALLERTRSAEGVEFVFAAKAGVADWVVDLARREAACCPFSTYHVALDGERVRWHTSSQAGPEVQAFLDEFHALPEHVAQGIEGLFARLATRGIKIVSNEPRRFSVESPGVAKPRSPAKTGCGC